jgi:NTP pyrophosphatase (non-canonical NTP hydrolase)
MSSRPSQIQRLQLALHMWREINFPGATPQDQFMGVVEEIGELSHADLKAKQNIRGSAEYHEAKAQDAVADTIIYLMGYCSLRGWDLSAILEETAAKVMKRDWNNDPLTGGDLDAT